MRLVQHKMLPLHTGSLHRPLAAVHNCVAQRSQPCRLSIFSCCGVRPAVGTRGLHRLCRPSCRRLHHTVRAATSEAAGEADIEEDTMNRMDKSMESTKQSFATVRTGRATPSMLDRIQVDYYGALTPLKQIANLSAPEAGMLVVQPYDKSSIPSIEKAIMSSDLGLTPGNDGNLIRINVPQLTADRRKEMAKLVSKLGEDGKVAIRNVRRDAIKLVDRLKGDVSEDEQKNLADAIQELTDDYVKQIDALVKSKQDELTTV